MFATFITEISYIRQLTLNSSKETHFKIVYPADLISFLKFISTSNSTKSSISNNDIFDKKYRQKSYLNIADVKCFLSDDHRSLSCNQSRETWERIQEKRGLEPMTAQLRCTLLYHNFNRSSVLHGQRSSHKKVAFSRKTKIGHEGIFELL